MNWPFMTHMVGVGNTSDIIWRRRYKKLTLEATVVHYLTKDESQLILIYFNTLVQRLNVLSNTAPHQERLSRATEPNVMVSLMEM